MAKIVGLNTSGLSVGAVISAQRESTNIPAGFLYCDGSAVSRTAYAALFALLGTTYGAGDGSTTFGIPDLRGRFLRALDTTASTRDPDKASRTGGTASKLGSTQAQATRKNGLDISDPGHRHGTDLIAGASTAPGAGLGTGGFNPSQAYTYFASSNVTLNSGDNETRPINFATNYFIAYI